MTPHVILVDVASVSRTIDHCKNTESETRLSLTKKSETSMEDFLSAVESAFAETRSKNYIHHHNSSDYNSRKRHDHNHEAPSFTQSRIDFATFHDDYRMQPQGNVNRFEITRDGVFVAVVLLGRPAFRLGESISVIIDFQQSAVHCHSLMAILESFEIIDPTIALRSQASIYRATRRIHASRFELTLFAKRATFNPIAPSYATPNFRTSSVSLVWSLRFEFMIRQRRINTVHDYLSEIVKNERGSASTGMQILPCEKFEVSVPLNMCGYVSSPNHNKTINEFSM